MSKEQSHAVPVDNRVLCMSRPFTSADTELRMFNAKTCLCASLVVPCSDDCFNEVGSIFKNG